MQAVRIEKLVCDFQKQHVAGTEPFGSIEAVELRKKLESAIGSLVHGKSSVEAGEIGADLREGKVSFSKPGFFMAVGSILRAASISRISSNR